MVSEYHEKVLHIILYHAIENTVGYTINATYAQTSF